MDCLALASFTHAPRPRRPGLGPVLVSGGGAWSREVRGRRRPASPMSHVEPLFGPDGAGPATDFEPARPLVYDRGNGLPCACEFSTPTLTQVPRPCPTRTTTPSVIPT